MYVVSYAGPFGFIKPWTAVRDGTTFSQQFLTPSIIEGMRQKLNIREILRHRLNYSGISIQQEVTQPRGWEKKLDRESKRLKVSRTKSILNRGVMIEPMLYLAFSTLDDAEVASVQHICLCRNEDVLLPVSEIKEMNEKEFDAIDGFELIFGKHDQAFIVGYNRFEDNKPMYGRLHIVGNPIRSDIIEI